MKALLRLVYASAMGITLALLLFWEHLDHIYKREFALSNAALLALDAAVLALLAAIAALMRRKGVLPISPGAAARVARILMAAVLFGVQIALCLNNLFEAGWDVAGVVASTRSASEITSENSTSRSSTSAASSAALSAAPLATVRMVPSFGFITAL